MKLVLVELQLIKQMILNKNFSGAWCKWKLKSRIILFDLRDRSRLDLTLPPDRDHLDYVAWDVVQVDLKHVLHCFA